jgi:putative polyhydroxyalkanoate system protein
MATIDIRRRHEFGLERARQAAVAIAKELEERIDVRYRWEGDDLTLDRTGATGRFEVRADEVRVLIDLGLPLRPLKGRVTKRVHEYLDEHFPV